MPMPQGQSEAPPAHRLDPGRTRRAGPQPRPRSAGRSARGADAAGGARCAPRRPRLRPLRRLRTRPARSRSLRRPSPNWWSNRNTAAAENRRRRAPLDRRLCAAVALRRRDPGAPPRVAILVTGLGLPDGPPQAALKGLPAQVSVAYGAYAGLQDGVAAARADGHEVLLQIPLEPPNYPTVDPGPHTLLTTLPPADNVKRLQWLMSRYTGYVGVTNHMGAKFQASAESIGPVLEELKRRGLLYVDAEATSPPLRRRKGDQSRLFRGQCSDRCRRHRAATRKARTSGQGARRRHRRGAPQARHREANHRLGGKLEGKGIVLVPISAAVRSRAQG